MKLYGYQEWYERISKSIEPPGLTDFAKKDYFYVMEGSVDSAKQPKRKQQQQTYAPIELVSYDALKYMRVIT